MSLSDWTIANPESAGLRSEPLRDLVEWLDGFGQANIHSVLVVRHGRLLFEHYRAGEDQCWGEPLGNVAHGPEVLADRGSIGSPESCVREHGSVLLMRRYHFDEETGAP